MTTRKAKAIPVAEIMKAIPVVEIMEQSAARPEAFTVTGKPTFSPITITIGTQDLLNELIEAMLALYNHEGTSNDMDNLYKELTNGKLISD